MKGIIKHSGISRAISVFKTSFQYFSKLHLEATRSPKQPRSQYLLRHPRPPHRSGESPANRTDMLGLHTDQGGSACWNGVFILWRFLDTAIVNILVRFHPLPWVPHQWHFKVESVTHLVSTPHSHRKVFFSLSLLFFLIFIFVGFCLRMHACRKIEPGKVRSHPQRWWPFLFHLLPLLPAFPAFLA